MDLIYEHEAGGKLYQCGYREIPHNLRAAKIHLVIYSAAECPPLKHHAGAELRYYPNEDIMVPKDSPYYKGVLETAEKAAFQAAKIIKKGKNVLVNCSQGINRSSLVVALAIREVSNLPSSEIIEIIKEKRFGALTNGSFIDMIMDNDDSPNPYFDFYSRD